MSTYLGIDETKPGYFLLDIIAPTEIQQTSLAMAEWFKASYASPLGIADLNARLWHLLGLSSNEGPLILFLSRLMDWERPKKQSVGPDNINQFKIDLRTQYGYSVDDSVDYARCYLAILAAGKVPMSIQQPWTYKPTTIAQDIGKMLGEGAGAATKAGLNIPLLILGAIAVYAGVTVFLPKVTTSLLAGGKH